MKRSLLLLLALALPVLAEVILAPEFGAGKLNYTSPSGKKSYADLREGKPKFTKGALELDNQELAYSAYRLVDLNNGTVSFDIEPVNYGPGQWKAGSNQFITLFAVANDSGYSQLWLFLSFQSSGCSLSFYSWDNQRTMLRAMASIKQNSAILKPGRKTRIAATWDPQTIRLFADGEEVANGSYGLGSNRTAGADMLVRLMPTSFNGKKIAGLKTRLSNFYLTNHAKTAAELKAEYTDSRTDTASLVALNALTAPRAAKLPVIDGKAAPGEWDDATKVPLQKRNHQVMLDSDIQATVSIKHDGKKLYCLFDVPGTKPPVLTAAPNAFGKEVYYGSLVEVYLRKQGSTRNDYYQFTVAPNNAWGVMAPNATFSEIPFEHHASIQEGRYQVEMAIPLEKAKLQRQKECGVNFGLFLPEVDHLSEPDRWIAWSGVKHTGFAYQCGTLTLGEGGTASRLEPLGGVNYGTLELHHRSAAGTRAELVILDGEGKPRIRKPFDDASNLDFTTPLGWLGSGYLTFKVIGADGGVRNLVSGKLLIKDPFDISFRTLPTSGKIEFMLNTSGIGKRAPGALRFQASLQDASGKSLSSCGQALKGLKETVAMSLPEVPVGKYTIRAYLKDGAKTYSKELPFERPDDRFLREPRGLGREIPSPWQGMRFKENLLEGTYFSYRFAKESPFPAAALKGKEEILTASALEVIANGKPQTLRHLGHKVVENAPDRVVTEGTLACSGAPLAIRYRRTASYDGLLRYDLTLVPSGKVTVQRLAWKGRVAPQHASYAINPNTTPAFIVDYSAAKSTTYRVFPVAWVTGLTYGFSVFTDNDANWVGTPNQQAILMEKTPAETTLTAEMISQPVAITREIPYVLAMMSTPGKPPRADWRQTYSHLPNKANTGGTYYRTTGWGSERKKFRWYRWICLTHLWDPEAARKHIAYFRKRGTEVIPYNCGALMPDSNPIYNYSGYEWRRSVGGRLLPPCEQGTDNDGVLFYGGMPVCANHRGFADYMTYYTDKYLSEYDLSGLYLDFGGVYATDAPYGTTDMTEYLTPGKQVRAWNVFGVRDLYERLRKVIQSHGKEKILWIHDWDRYHPAITSFADLIYPGEEYMHTIRVNRRVYGEKTPLVQWQAAYRSQIFGASVQFLTQYRYFREPIHNPKKSVAEKLDFARDLMTMILLHDITMSDTFTSPWHEVWDRLEMRKATFTGYYTGVPVVTDNPVVKTGLYRWPDQKKVVLILGNTSNKPASFRLDDSKLPLEGKALDLFTNKEVDLKQTFQFRDFDFMVLEANIKP